MMLRGNLATRPFYNERLVSLALILLALVVAVLTIFNVTRLRDLSSQRSALRSQISADEAKAAEIRAGANAVQNSVDRAALMTLGGSTREANSLITARTFSWSTFFGYIEDKMPLDVRLTAVSPEVEKGEILVTMLLLGRSESDIDAFARGLEDTGAFQDANYAVADHTEEGLRRVTLRAFYLPPRFAPDAPPPAPAGGQR